MRKQTTITTILAACVIALATAACTVTKDATPDSATTSIDNTATGTTTTSIDNTASGTTTTTTSTSNSGDGINVHFGDGRINVDTPLFKLNKAGRGEKLHVDIPQIRIESK